MKYFALFAALFLVIACGTSDHPGFIDDQAGGTGGSGASAGHAGHAGSSAAGKGGGSDGNEAGEGGAAGTPDQNLLAPLVQITSPSAVSDPNKGVVVTGLSVIVVCSVTQSAAAGAQPVLGSSIKIQMYGADGKQIGKDGAVMSTTNANQYSAPFVLTNVPSGVISFACEASDQSAAANTTTTTVSTYFDAGPIIAITDPADKSAHPLAATSFKFSALPNLLATK
jgi:hypothetical protein